MLTLLNSAEGNLTGCYRFLHRAHNLLCARLDKAIYEIKNFKP